MSVGVYAGTFISGTGGSSFWTTDSWSSFVDQWNSLASGPACLVGVDTHQDNAGTTFYTGAWAEVASQTEALWRSSDWSFFLAKFNENAGQSRLLDFDIHSSGGFRMYTGTWGGTPIKQTLVTDLLWTDFQVRWQTLSGQGMRLSKLQLYPSDAPGQYRVAGLFEQAKSANEPPASTPNELVDFQFYDDDVGARYYAGVWRQLPTSTTKQQFVVSLDYNSFVNQWQALANQGLLLQKAIKYSKSVMVPQPSWDAYFKANLAPISQGYAYTILKDGKVVASGAYGNARNAHDSPQTVFSLDSRMHLASVSKTVTAVTVLKILGDRGISVDTPFWDPYMKKQVPTVGAGVNKITIRHLLNMTSGMNDDVQAIWFSDYWGLVKSYLGKQNVAAGAPGKTYQYSNTNYMILQAFVDCLLGNDGKSASTFPQYVATNILKPMGVDTSVFTTGADAPSRATLYYGPQASTSEAGFYYSAAQNVGGSGWVSSARHLSNFLAGVRLNTVLKADVTLAMITGNLGWDSTADNYIYHGLYGRYHQKNGALYTSDVGGQGLRTAIVRLSHGYDALLITNSNTGDVVPLIYGAFDQRG